MAQVIRDHRHLENRAQTIDNCTIPANNHSRAAIPKPEGWAAFLEAPFQPLHPLKPTSRKNRFSPQARYNRRAFSPLAATILAISIASVY
jgi:hypothetical protein